jgi:hypothetical protein
MWMRACAVPSGLMGLFCSYPALPSRAFYIPPLRGCSGHFGTRILLRGWTFGAQELENGLLRLHHFVDNHLAALFGVDDLVYGRIAT